MMLKTGIRGFTLLEVMVASAVLALGIVFIFDSFFVCLDSFDYYRNYLKVASWLDEKTWQSQDDISHWGMLVSTPASGEFISANRKFYWNLSSELIAPPSLYKISAVLSWKEGKRNVKLLRNTYALYATKE